MLTDIHVTSFPSLFPPAYPTISQMLGTMIEYVNARPFERTPLHAVGLVIGFALRKGDLYLKVQNSTTCRERWIAESDFVRYSH